MKNILLLTDFSKNSINAMRYALNLFENSICNFYILNVENSSVYASADIISAGNESIYNSVIKKIRDRIKKLIVELENEFKNSDFSFYSLVSYNDLTEAIKQIHISKDIHLVVMGTNGVTGTKEIMFGSNTINVIRDISCPTLVIPEKYTYKMPKDILLPLDLADSLTGNAFMGVVEFAKKFSEKVHLLRILPTDEALPEEIKDIEYMNSILTKTQNKYYKIINVPMHYVVSCYLQTHAIDLIALLVQKESFVERFFTGSTTKQISNKITVPLLVLRD
jgi:nucleotide-binding universal stress UspA family protein